MYVNHEDVVKPETIWAQCEVGDAYLNRYVTWWRNVYYKETDRRRVPGHLHMRFIREIFGPQAVTVTFVHRNRVWHELEEGWTLYVDRRGPAFHVRSGMTASEAWEAFQKFTQKFETATPPPPPPKVAPQKRTSAAKDAHVLKLEARLREATLLLKQLGAADPSLRELIDDFLRTAQT